MSRQPEDRFRLQPRPPKALRSGHTARFTTLVLRELGKSGAKSSNRFRVPTLARLGRGHVAAGMSGLRIPTNARRVIVKCRFLVVKDTGARSVATHLRYIEREGVDRAGNKGHAYDAFADKADLAEFEQRGHGDRHQFRLIVSPEDAVALEDLRTFTRHLMSRMEADLGTRLEWVAVDHWNTDNPHTHVVLHGRDQAGKDLIISREYISHGMRRRASELATEWLGPRSDREMRESARREIDQERWTGLDRALQQHARDGTVDLLVPVGAQASAQRTVLIGRLQRLTSMGLATPSGVNAWKLRPDFEKTLRAMGERGDIVRTMQRAIGNRQRQLEVFAAGPDARPLVGSVIGKGLADELLDRGYLVVDGIDGRAHYVALNNKADLSQYPIGAIVEVGSTTQPRSADKTIATLAKDGLYRTDDHLVALRAQTTSDRDLKAVVVAHVRRLEALRRVGIVERLADGLWQIPTDLPKLGQDYDARRIGAGAVELQSHLPIERQVRAIGATWLDRQLIGGVAGITDAGFGGEVRSALRQRAEFLVEEGLAKVSASRVVLARNLLETLRRRDVDLAARAIASETRLHHYPVVDGERVSGVYRRTVLLTSGRFAMLDDGIGFSLVPWRPVIEPRLGLSVTAVMRNGGVSWTLGRQQGR